MAKDLVMLSWAAAADSVIVVLKALAFALASATLLVAKVVRWALEERLDGWDSSGKSPCGANSSSNIGRGVYPRRTWESGMKLRPTTLRLVVSIKRVLPLLTTSVSCNGIPSSSGTCLYPLVRVRADLKTSSYA